MSAPITEQELRKREATYRATARRYELARAARNEAVSKALAEGWTHSQVAEATGLTRSRVGQLAESGQRWQQNAIPALRTGATTQGG